LLGTPASFTNDPTGGATSSLWVGGQNDPSSSKATFLGRLDEFRIEGVARSTAWLAAQRLSMTDALITYGAPEAF
jgi:hypothetical protein